MSLKDKLDKIRQKKSENKIDWEGQKNSWINDVSNLFNAIEEMFREYETEGLITFASGRLNMREQYIGDYQIPTLDFKLIGESILFRPIGTVIVGSHGRIDVYLRGKAHEKVMLIRLRDEQLNYSWEIWQSTDHEDRSPLNKENLEKLIEKWIDPIHNQLT